MIFTWLKRRRRRRLLASPFLEDWHSWLARLAFYPGLREEQQARLQDITRVMVAEKNWVGCRGQVITDEIRVTIAAQAALLLLEIEHDHYRRVGEILVYPSTFVVPDHENTGRGGSPVLGLAQHGGPVVLAWDAVRIGGDNWKDGRNVVLHEFAHKLDMLDGWADGTPPLRQREQYGAWKHIMTEEYESLVAAAEDRRPTLLDKYGATNAAEFFAIATECFFEKPRQMQRRHPELYDLLSSYYRQTP